MAAKPDTSIQNINGTDQKVLKQPCLLKITIPYNETAFSSTFSSFTMCTGRCFKHVVNLQLKQNYLVRIRQHDYLVGLKKDNGLG